MPELPEVETMRRSVAPLEGSRIVAVERPPCKLRSILFEPALKQWHRRVVGQRIARCERHGKRVVLRLERGELIVIEPRMSGIVLLRDPPNQTHLRLRIATDHPKHPELLFWDSRGLGTVRLIDGDQESSLLGHQRLGPDALEITESQLRERLQGSRRAVKVALLDQQVVAGIGNIYASEILHLARIDPRTMCSRIDAGRWQRMVEATKVVLQAAIDAEGSTLRDGTYRKSLQQEGAYQHYHRVYDRKDQPCLQCGEGKIVRLVQAQRSTYFCPKCQKKR
jgi:formamidopyrimidine-DNA glycosylase